MGSALFMLISKYGSTDVPRSLALLTSAFGAMVFGKIVTVTLLPEPKGISLEQLAEGRTAAARRAA